MLLFRTDNIFNSLHIRSTALPPQYLKYRAQAYILTTYEIRHKVNSNNK
jgi:hypothetical protein